MIPFLLELALTGTATTDSGKRSGLAADVGASTGNCGFVMLSHGHEVHLFDGNLDVPGVYGREVIEMTIKANKWTNRTHYHGVLMPGTESSLDWIFSSRLQLDLLKIDVDHMSEWDNVLKGATETLRRTTVAQLELIESEIGLSGIYSIMKLFTSLQFDVFLLEAKDAHGKPHWSLSRGGKHSEGCPEVAHTSGTWPVTTRMRQRGFALYGENAMRDIRLKPLCFCGAEVLPRYQECLVRASLQVTVIRRGTSAHEKAGRDFGTCRCNPPGGAGVPKEL